MNYFNISQILNRQKKKLEALRKQLYKGVVQNDLNLILDCSKECGTLAQELEDLTEALQGSSAYQMKRSS